MNWVGGARNRLKRKSEKKIQQQYFEEKRKIQKYGIISSSIPSAPKSNSNAFSISQDLLSLQTIVRTHDKTKNLKRIRPQIEIPNTKDIRERHSLITSSSRSLDGNHVHMNTNGNSISYFQKDSLVQNNEMKQEKVATFNDSPLPTNCRKHIASSSHNKSEDLTQCKTLNNSLYFNLFGLNDVAFATTSKAVSIECESKNRISDSVLTGEKKQTEHVNISTDEHHWYNLSSNSEKSENLIAYNYPAPTKSKDQLYQYFPYSTPGPHSRVSFEMAHRNKMDHEFPYKIKEELEKNIRKVTISPEEMMEKVDELLDDKSTNSSVNLDDKSAEENPDIFEENSENTAAASSIDVLSQKSQTSNERRIISDTPQKLQSHEEDPLKECELNQHGTFKEYEANKNNVQQQTVECTPINSVSSLQEILDRNLTLLQDFNERIYERRLYLKACLLTSGREEDGKNDEYCIEDDEKMFLNSAE